MCGCVVFFLLFVVVFIRSSVRRILTMIVRMLFVSRRVIVMRVRVIMCRSIVSVHWYKSLTVSLHLCIVMAKLAENDLGNISKSSLQTLSRKLLIFTKHTAFQTNELFDEHIYIYIYIHI